MDCSLYDMDLRHEIVNPFLAKVLIIYPLKTPESDSFPAVFRGYKIGTLSRNGLRAATHVIINMELLKSYPE